MMIKKYFSALAVNSSHWMGEPISFIIAMVLVFLWGLSGPLLGFSNTWQLLINTGTTVLTFLMVFLIQYTQNRDGEAMQKKLDEIIRALDEADDHLIGLEKKLKRGKEL